MTWDVSSTADRAGERLTFGVEHGQGATSEPAITIDVRQ